MANKVKCLICGEELPKTSPDCIKVRRNRYAHRACAKEAHMEEFNEETAPPPKVKPQGVKCKYCGGTLQKTDEDCVHVSNRYAHRACYDQAPPEEHAQENFYDWCSQFFKKEYDHMKTKRMVEKYLQENPSWNYSGMLKALQWFYEIQKRPITQAAGSVGILPYIYEKAKQYYYELYLAEKSAEGIQETKIEEKEIDITAPQKRKERKLKLIEFEEDDE